MVIGEVPRTTAFETGLPPVTRHGWMASGGTTRWSTKTRRWWRMSPAAAWWSSPGAGTPGIVNIVRQAKRLTGVDQIYLVTGGLHLRDGPVLATTVAALTEERPQLIVPAHCTSWVAHRCTTRCRRPTGRTWSAAGSSSGRTETKVSCAHPVGP